MRDLHSQSAAFASRSPTVDAPNTEGQRCNTVAVLHGTPHRRTYVLASYRAAHERIEAAFPAGMDGARTELAAMFPDLVANIDRAEQTAERAATAYQDGATASPDAFTGALASWERAVLDALTALDSARQVSSASTADLNSSTQSRRGLGQRVCGRCLREVVAHA